MREVIGMNHLFEQIHGKLVVSCQALPEEPLHSPFIMGKMAYAALLGGAAGIRANSVEDIREIKSRVTLPIIGIIKQVYGDCPVFITPTMAEVEALCEEGVDLIAMDATDRERPDGSTIVELFPQIRAKYPNQLFMADCSTYKEGVQAVELGFDCVGTTLSGYTAVTKGRALPDFELASKLVQTLSVPVIAEGGISSPEELRRMFDLGVYSAVVGSAITRPMEITQRFLKALE
jgi:N-acylglucosamine-6-phosphate 2-epimerase